VLQGISTSVLRQIAVLNSQTRRIRHSNAQKCTHCTVTGRKTVNEAISLTVFPTQDLVDNFE
jgi:hypothetical protein